MEFRNPAYNRHGTIDAEVNHPVHGWIPTTLSAYDPATSEIYALALAAGPEAYTPPSPAEVQSLRAVGVNVERDRRLAAGATIAITGYGDIAVHGTPGDQINLIALGMTARDMVAAGVTAAAIPFRDPENTVHTLTPAQVLELERGGKEAAQAIYAASWALKDSGDIPENYTADQHWT